MEGIMVRAVLCLALVLALLPSPACTGETPLDPAWRTALPAWSLGPGHTSGRVTAIAGVESDPDVVYVGAAGGGVWKTVNGGATWEPVFDDQPVASIGAVAVFQANPAIVWVGTGEGNPHQSVTPGRGVYRSVDGGRTWAHLGLDATEHISRIVLDPQHPEVAWVAALGHVWGENPERGVFKTEDGGTTWTKVLYVDERTGAADLAIDPRNPRKLYAAMWQHRRWPWLFLSGGPGSGLYVSQDAGRTWSRRSAADGLPGGELGRIKIAVSASNPDTVYAMVEADLGRAQGVTGALLRSDDGGVSFRTVNTTANLYMRPFYFAALAVDPQWPNRVYNLDEALHVSDDNGRTFRYLLLGQGIHPDFHALWIDPRDPRHLWLGTDGGVAVSHDRGRTAIFIDNLPLGQYYAVAVDAQIPFNIYGGLQDNGAWRGPSDAWAAGGITDRDWTFVGWGDGSATLADPADPDLGYKAAQQAGFERINLKTGELKDIAPPSGPAPGTVHLRFNFTPGLAVDPFTPGTLYAGSQFVHRSADRGDSWTVISPDLSTNNPEWQKQAESGGLSPDAAGAETYTAITAIAPSPLRRGLLWVGTDDGRLHVTQDGGATWQSVEANVWTMGKAGVPAHAWVRQILPSRHDPAVAFAVFDDHRRGDRRPYVARTGDYGLTWRSLVTPQLSGYALAIEQDPVDPDLLFLGTEAGLWVSFDGGGAWQPWRHGVPPAPVTGLVIHPRDGDLVIATFGRGVYVIDDIAPLRALTPAVLAAPFHLFPVPDARQHWNRAVNTSRGAGAFHAESRPYGALLTVWAREEGSAEVRVADAAGQTIRVFHADVVPGLNRISWGLERNTFKLSPRAAGQPPRDPEAPGPEVEPGTYTVTVRLGDSEAHQTVRVLPDPRSPHSEADVRARRDAILRAGHLQDLAITAAERLRRTRADVAAVAEKVRTDADPAVRPALRTAAADLQKKIDALEARLRVSAEMPIGTYREDKVTEHVWAAVDSLQTSFDPPSSAQLERLRIAEEALGPYLAELDRFYAVDVAAFRKQVAAAGLELIREEPPRGV
jgi:photosystem II stability/assembly factor-like uncharacterized protein